jgi:hypothetical protein
MTAQLDTEVGRDSTMHVPHALVDPEENLLQQLGKGVDQKIEVCFPGQTTGENIMDQ